MACRENTLFLMWPLSLMSIAVAPVWAYVLCSSHSKHWSCSLFPTLSLLRPVNQTSWLSLDGRQSLSHYQWKWGLVLCLPLPLFMPPCLLKFVHVYSLSPPPSPTGQLFLYLLESRLQWVAVQRVNHGCQDAAWPRLLLCRRVRPGIVWKRAWFGFSILCICPLSGQWINMRVWVGAGTAWMRRDPTSVCEYIYVCVCVCVCWWGATRAMWEPSSPAGLHLV